VADRVARPLEVSRVATKVAGARLEQSNMVPVTVTGLKNALSASICLSLLVSEALGYVVYP
jgi:hypothetical protein